MQENELIAQVCEVLPSASSKELAADMLNGAPESAEWTVYEGLNYVESMCYALCDPYPESELLRKEADIALHRIDVKEELEAAKDLIQQHYIDLEVDCVSPIDDLLPAEWLAELRETAKEVNEEMAFGVELAKEKGGAQ